MERMPESTPRMDVADRVMDERLHNRTKKGYASKMRYILSFLKDHPEHHACVCPQSNEINLPLSFKAVKDIFGALAIDTSLPKQSVSQRHRIYFSS